MHLASAYPFWLLKVRNGLPCENQLAKFIHKDCESPELNLHIDATLKKF